MLFQHESSIIFRSISTIPVFIVFGIITLEYYDFMFLFIQIKKESIHIIPILEIILFHMIMLLICFSYYRTITTDPGYINTDIIDEIENIETNIINNNNSHIDKSKMILNLKKCKKCKLPKFPTVHHCSICQRCVIRMDHHCPWVVNCIGAFNYRYFIQFLFYSFMANLMITCIGLNNFLNNYINIHLNDNTFISSIGCIGYILSFSLSIVLLLFICFHLYLTCTGNTTIELSLMNNNNKKYNSQLIFNKKNYKYSNIQTNWVNVFGLSKIHWFLPILYSTTKEFKMNYLKNMFSLKQENNSILYTDEDINLLV